MDQITLRLEEDTVEQLEDEADEAGTTRSEYLRDLIESRHEHERRLEDLRRDLERTRTEHEQEVDELRTEVERLRREKRQILEQREEHTELVKAVQSEQSLAEKRARAGVATRVKWWLVGMGDEG